ncbi:hypothetical protein NHE_0744 [Neorickettsia helminthoeca str. Oregon]|uniref:Uncharacterized protein n=1 Tax=Neorickettsia helminthoeca str. Oregon TaxID=1286528 RepID=X5H524_9RICK|nr:hypothetical protein [Neorickettsia helminthoeca]AHX11676.1 hypothetical protein NHE_0744 [Neorickettsia helminthoeca str. Oregon]
MNTIILKSKQMVQGVRCPGVVHNLISIVVAIYNGFAEIFNEAGVLGIKASSLNGL